MWKSFIKCESDDYIFINTTFIIKFIMKTVVGFYNNKHSIIFIVILVKGTYLLNKY